MAGPAFEVISQHRSFGGVVGFYRHDAATTACSMRFAVFAPPQAQKGRVPVLYYLAGLTCTEETFMIKAGAQRIAAELGLMLVAPDTSPRGVKVAGDTDSWDFGVAAGFYVDATEAGFPSERERQGIFGHSMGGHGALVIALKNPERYRSVSAFAPIAAPKRCPWGQKAFAGYLGADHGQWSAYDATELVGQVKDAAHRPPILIDQGSADQFLEQQLQPQLFEEACRRVGYPVTLRHQAGYDHSYYFISTFMEEHLRHHQRTLQG
jgi:S-formylglutathione hydrolase